MKGTWEARINLGCNEKNGCTVLTKNEHEGPLVVQKAFYPEEVAHIYLLHPPGGIAGCDRLETKVSLGPRSHVLLTTPGSTKFYRTEGDLTSLVKQTYAIASDASLEILPQANIYFKGTHTKVATDIHVAPKGRFFFRDVAICGSPAHGADFLGSAFLNTISVWRDAPLAPLDHGVLVDKLSQETLQLREVSRVDGNRDLLALAGLNGCQSIGTVLAAPATPQDLELARMALADYKGRGGATLLGDLLVIRLLDVANEPLEHMITSLWLKLRPSLLGRKPVIPRVWAT